MAELSNLDTTQVGVLCYWNAVDDGADSAQIDPTNVLNYDTLDTYDQYDNGVQGTATVDRYGTGETSGQEWREVTVHYRVKTDGWFLTWLPRTENKQVDVQQGNYTSNGLYDIARAWMNFNNPVNAPPDSTLQDLMELLAGYCLTESSPPTPTSPSYYDYKHPNANTWTQITANSNSGNNSSNQKNFGVGYETGTTRKYHAVAAGSNDGSVGEGYARFEGYDIADSNNGHVNKAGVIDALAHDGGSLVGSDETLYDAVVGGYDYDDATETHIIFCEV